MPVPLVSALMITYNHIGYVARAIEGVLQQKTSFPIELVIGEDCSTDGTRECVLDYQKRYPDVIRVITSARNVGAKKNGLRSMKACSGKFIAVCEGDDYWHHPEKLQKQVDYMEKNPDCGMVCSNYDVMNAKTKMVIKDFITYKKWKIPDRFDPSYFISDDVSSVILTCTVLYQRALSESIIRKDPYLHESDTFLMGDIQMWADISSMARIGYIPESLATYNVSEESATRSRDITRELHFSLSMSELILYLCEKYRMPADVRKRHEEYWCRTKLKLAFYERNLQGADDVRKRAIKFNYLDWYRYYGAKYPMVYCGGMFLESLKKRLPRKRRKWYE
jgi:glycosyltransferase involved in cell wall biosynthesis